MKTYVRVLTITLLSVLTLCLCLVGCNGEPSGTEETTVSVTDAPTDPAETSVDTEPGEDTSAPTEESSAGATETPTETPTEPVTEPPALMPTVDADVLVGKEISDYFTRGSRCEVTLVDDETEGKVIRLSTAKVTSVNAGKPSIYLKLADLVEDSNGIMPKTSENPYLVLKVRAGDLWSRTFGIQAGESVRMIDTTGTLISSRLDATEEWQYIYFDLTDFDEELEVFYLCFEYGTAKNGEYLDIAELRFVATEEEAITLAGIDIYPVDPQTADDYTLKIISYNIWVGNGTDLFLRADIFRDFIDTYQPDSIGMQEVTPAWRDMLDSFVFNESYAGVGEERSAGGEASAIYYRKDKFDLLDHGTFWLSETPDTVGSMYGTANYPRICTWAHLRDRETGLEYVHVNTHLDHNGDNTAAVGREIRLFQTRVILEFVDQLGDLPMVFTGDFNQAPSNSKDNYYDQYKNITGLSSFTAADGTEITGPFSDARVDAPVTVSPEQWATMTDYHEEDNSKYDPAHKPIDYIFYTASHLEAMTYESLYHHRDGQYMSDHLPQIAEFHFRSADSAVTE